MKPNFKASFVSRIAFVDNPAVPDAQMIFYKRHDKNDKKGGEDMDEAAVTKAITDAIAKIDERIKPLEELAKTIKDAKVAEMLDGIQKSITAMKDEHSKALAPITEQLKQLDDVKKRLETIEKMEQIGKLDKRVKAIEKLSGVDNQLGDDDDTTDNTKKRDVFGDAVKGIGKK